MFVTVQLSTLEIAERAQELARLISDLIGLEREEETQKKDHANAMAGLKRRRLELSGQINKFGRAVRLGVEERDTQGMLFDLRQDAELDAAASRAQAVRDQDPRELALRAMEARDGKSAAADDDTHREHMRKNGNILLSPNEQAAKKYSGLAVAAVSRRRRIASTRSSEG